ncbi:Ig-like domain repeat protein [Nocardioides carbamazepini]|uniref:Ig-like domain repeat protein n=1 Tax=Nocardioides carbamazepini TaxID=2854259 RepID=UPI002149F3BB|nr:Ig-like domain repeat protein [Nocardioides carbamazepini]MCR1785907.1 Ig-like domain repeat protein [Nocardioides carbamazepini]
MGPRPIHRPRHRGTALLCGVLTALALVLGLAPAASAAPDDEPDPGTIDVYVTFEGYNLGQGYYAEPVKLTVPDGTTAAEVTESVLEDGDHDFDDPGDPTSGGWYLAKVKGFDTGVVNVPSHVTSQPGFQLIAEDGDGYLGQFDYSQMSGWMYTVDNVMAPVGAGAWELTDGEVMRWQFTMHGYGCDTGVPTGCWGAEPYFTMADKSELIRTLADPAPATATEAEIEDGLDVAIDPLATEVEVDEAILALTQATAVVEPWVTIAPPSQGLLLNRMQRALRNEFGQNPDSYDYSVLEKVRITGSLNSQDYADLRNPAYAGTSIEELDLSGVIDGTTYALNGMTALTDVSLPPVASYNVANPFQGNSSLRNVVVAAETYDFGSATTFNGITTLERIIFLHPTKPRFNASTFNGSNNADPENRTVVAVVPDETRGDYDKTTFSSYFSDVVEAPTRDDRLEVRSVIDEASSIGEGAAVPFRWTLLQDALATATVVRRDPAATAADLHQARLVLQTAIGRVGFDGPGLSVKVTKGADVTLSWKNGTAQHYAEFVSYPVAKVDALSDASHDVYVPTTPVAYSSQKIATAVIEGETDKVAKIFTVNAGSAETQYTLDLTPLEGRVDTSLAIPGLGAGDPRNLYTNLDDTGVVNLEVGEHFDLDTYRTSQAQLDQVNNLFIEPDYTFEVSGDSVTTSEVGYEGRRQLRIDAEQPGVSVIKITYDPLHYLAANDNGTPGNTNWSFNGIEEQNTGLVVVNVGGDDPSFDTGIDVRNELDTYYFDEEVGYRPFAFTPDAGTTVRVHQPLNRKSWGTGWRGYEPAEDGEFTVRLRGGRNIIELTNGGETTYYVVRAKAIDVSIENTTDPGQEFETGDVARISMVGVEGGIEKLGGIYNPAFVAGTRPKLTYSDGMSSIQSNEGGQYTSATTTYALDYTVPAATEATLNGHLSIGGLGSEWPYHRIIPLEGKPANLNAVAIGPYDLGATPPVYLYDGRLTTAPDVIPVDTEALQTALSAAGELDEADYTAVSWTTLQAAVGAATAVAADEDATQGEVDQAATVLDDAIDQLVPVTAPEAPAKPEVSVDGDAVTVTWVAPQDSGSPITGYTVALTPAGGAAVTRTAGAGATSAVVDDLPAGTYTATVTATNAKGDSAASAASAEVTVAAALIATSVSATAPDVAYGQAGRVRVTVSAASGQESPTGTVSAKIAGRTVTGALSDGRATLEIPARSLEPGTTGLTIAYEGADGRFNASSTQVTVKVARATPTLTIEKRAKKVARGKVAIYRIAITAPGVTPTGKVTVRIAGRSKTVTVDGQGVAVVKVKVKRTTKPGAKKVKATYGGDAHVDPAKVKAKTRVTR